MSEDKKLKYLLRFCDGLDASIADPRSSVSHDQVVRRWTAKRSILLGKALRPNEIGTN